MPITWLDHLTPQALGHLALGAWGLLLVGLVLWLFGVGIAHFLAVVIMGAAGAASAVWGVPRMGWDFSPLTLGVAGFVIGAAMGALTFRVMQAVLLAASLGVAVAGVYYGWHVMPGETAAEAFQGVPVTSLKDAGRHLLEDHPHDVAAPTQLDLQRAGERLMAQWNNVDHRQYYHMAIAGVGTAVAALLFGLTFPRMTTILITAALGALLVYCSVFVLGRAYAASHMSWWPMGALKRYAMLAGLAVVGIAIQCRIFRHLPDKAPKKTLSPQPSAA